MCASMADIQSATAEIRREKERRRRKKKKKEETTGWKYSIFHWANIIILARSTLSYAAWKILTKVSHRIFNRLTLPNETEHDKYQAVTLNRNEWKAIVNQWTCMVLCMSWHTFWDCMNRSDPFPGWTSYKATKPGFSFMRLFYVRQAISFSFLVHMCPCCIRFSFQV